MKCFAPIADAKGKGEYRAIGWGTNSAAGAMSVPDLPANLAFSRASDYTVVENACLCKNTELKYSRKI